MKFFKYIRLAMRIIPFIQAMIESIKDHRNESDHYTLENVFHTMNEIGTIVTSDDNKTTLVDVANELGGLLTKFRARR